MSELIELVAGLVIVVAGSELLAKAAEGIAKTLKKAYVVGAVLLALSGNLPELAVSLSAILAGHPDLAIASIVGSVAVNILIVMGISALLGGWKKDLIFDSKKLQADLPMLVGAMGFFLFINLGRASTIHMIDGVILLLTYVLLLRFMLFSHKEVYVTHEETGPPTRPLWQYGALFALSAAMVAVGAELLVSGVKTVFIDTMRMDEKFVGFTILALAANLPEHLAAIKSALKGNGEMAVGNAIGSASQAIYLILGLLIVFSVLNGDPLPTHFDPIYLSTFVISVLLTVVIVNDGRLTWFEGWVCLIIYALAAVSMYYPG
jgi:calcium/proton exchanger cax